MAVTISKVVWWMESFWSHKAQSLLTQHKSFNLNSTAPSVFAPLKAVCLDFQLSGCPWGARSQSLDPTRHRVTGHIYSECASWLPDLMQLCPLVGWATPFSPPAAGILTTPCCHKVFLLAHWQCVLFIFCWCWCNHMLLALIIPQQYSAVPWTSQTQRE